MKRRFAAALAVALVVSTASVAPAAEPMHDASAAAYEHLATALIELRATEDRLVQGILFHHYNMAKRHLEMARAAGSIGMHGKAAAEEVTNLANEGNKQVQAIRQRLLKAGHHHHTDTETEEDYIWIDSSERKALLDFAGRIAKLADVKNVPARIDELSALFDKVMKPE